MFFSFTERVGRNNERAWRNNESGTVRAEQGKTGQNRAEHGQHRTEQYIREMIAAERNEKFIQNNKILPYQRTFVLLPSSGGGKTRQTKQ